MHFNFCNVIFITTIYLIFSNVYAGPKKDCNELLMNTTDIFASQNGTNCRPEEELQQNSAQMPEEEKNIPGIVNFLTREADSSIFNNNEKVFDILKSVLNSNENKETKTKFGNNKEHDMESNAKHFTVTSDFSMNASNGKIDAKENPLATTTIRNILETNLGNAFDILKNSSWSLLAKETAKDNRDYSDNSTAVIHEGQDYAQNSKVSNKTESERDDQTNSTEINLSEITNLSRDAAAGAALGQKIKYQRSLRDSGAAATNMAGKEILQNTTGICGYLLGKRVSFAEPTTLMEFPWTALLLYNTNIRYHCGGSLITTKYVLTAAHCVAQEFYELTGVRLGEHDISEPVDCAPDVAGSKICAITVDVNVVKIVVHHDYSHLSFKNDIALLRLDNEYLGRSYYPICLPTPEMIYEDKRATVAGWGATEKAIRSSILLKATVPIFDISKCSEIYRYKVFNDSTEICASGANEVDVCKGDSGGAIFYNKDFRGKNRFFQLGIISLGVRGCGDKRFLPAIFTKINGFYKWIENNLEY